MNHLITINILAIILMLAIIISLALKPPVVQKMLGLSITISGLLGILIYGASYGYEASSIMEVLAAAGQTVFTTSAMFAGKHDYSSFIKAFPNFSTNKAVVVLFWTVHLMALYATASAMLTALGDRLLRTVRLFLARFHSPVIIYGDVNEAITLLSDIRKIDDSRYVLIISSDLSSSDKAKIIDKGGLFLSESALPKDGSGLFTKSEFLKVLGIRNGEKSHSDIVIFANDDLKAQNFVIRLLDNLDRAAIEPSKVTIQINCANEYDFVFAQNRKSKAHHNSCYVVNVVCRAELVARKLIKVAPPYRSVRFDDNYNADQDFRLLLLGFGDVGEAVLKQIVMNAQFLGSTFSALIVDKNNSNIAGKFKTDYAEMIHRYNISFMDCDVMSEKFWRQISNTDMDLYDYIVVSLGDDRVNRQCANKIKNAIFVAKQNANGSKRNESGVILAECDTKRITIHNCYKNNPVMVFASPENGSEAKNETYTISDVDAQITGRIDKAAYIINATYIKEKNMKLTSDKQIDPLKDWRAMNSFTRSSNRASADFVNALIATIGLESISFNDKDLGNKASKLLAELERLDKEGRIDYGRLGQLEHKRWLAFHYASGLLPMDHEEMVRRNERLKTLSDEEKESFSIRKYIPTGGIGGRHICMVDWDELDQVSFEYNKLTGENVDFKVFDIPDFKKLSDLIKAYCEIE